MIREMGFPSVESIDSRPQVRRAQMGVTDRHRDIGMPQHFLNILQAGAAHQHVARGGVTEVMEPEVWDLRTRQGAGERGSDLAPRPRLPAEEEPGATLGLRLERDQARFIGTPRGSPGIPIALNLRM